MSTLSQLSYNHRFYKRIAKKPYSDTSKLAKNPQLKCLVKRLAIMTPKKPNSALRHVCKVSIYLTNRRLIARIPGNKSWPNKFCRVLVEGGRANDLPTVRYTVIRGKYDCIGLSGKIKRRSIYGVKRPVGYTNHLRRRVRHFYQ